MHLTSFFDCVWVLASLYGESLVKIKIFFGKLYSVRKEFDAQNISVLCSIRHHLFQKSVVIL